MSYSLPFQQGHKVIELGGGQKPIFRPNLDIRACPEVDIVADLNEPLPVKNDEWDGVFCSYLWEHLSWRKISNFLKEVNRIIRPGGVAVFVTPNSEAQMRHLLDTEDWDDASSMLFGDQNYEGDDWRANSHCNFVSPYRASKLLSEAGFDRVIMLPWGEKATDMIIEARKSLEIMPRKEMFDKHYFHGGLKVGGYPNEGYRDFPSNWAVFEHIMDRKPDSVLELGAARGYIVKRLQDVGIRAGGMDISRHCMLTRVANNVIEYDICNTPWPFPDKNFDLCFSMDVLDKIPEKNLPAVFAEIERVSNRGLHGISFEELGQDKTRCTIKPKEWWVKLTSTQEIISTPDLLKCKGLIWSSIPVGDDKLKANIGAYINMSHYGWVNIDILNLSEFAKNNYYKFYQRDVREGLPFENDSVDLGFCVCPGAFIRTSGGLKKIEDVKIGDMALTHLSRWRRVSNTFVRHVKDESVTKLHGCCLPFYITNNHKIYIAQGKKDTHGIFHYDDYQWLIAGKINTGDRIILPFPIPEVNKIIDLSLSLCDEKYQLVERVKAAKVSGMTYDEIEKIHKVARKTAQQWVLGTKHPRNTMVLKDNLISYCQSNIKLPKIIPINYDTSRLIGYFISDGTASLMKMGGHTCFYFEKNQKKYINDVKKLMKVILGIKPTEIKLVGKMWQIRYCNRCLARIMKTITHVNGECRRGFKIIPKEFFCGDRESLIGLVIGLWRGDGTVSKTKASYTTVNPYLAFQIQEVLARIGIVSRISSVMSFDPKKTKKSVQYRLLVSGPSLRILALYLGIKVYEPRKKMKQRSFIGPSRIELQVKASNYKYTGLVYNIEVEEDNSYTVNGVAVHNCSHMLEHLTYDEGKAFLKECKRVMKIGAVMRIMVPDAELLVNGYKSKNLSIYHEINDGAQAAPSEVGKLWAILFSGHQAAYDWDTIEKMANDVGLHAEKKTFREGHKQIISETNDMLPELSLFVELSKMNS
jgi:predicted SAM-dependent methyltransferase